MRCIVPGCNVDSNYTSTSKYLNFFTFPNEPTLRETWLKLVANTGLEVTEESAVCSKHFRTDDLCFSENGYCSLRAAAIPVLYMQHAPKSENWVSCDVKVCRICFSSDCNLYAMKNYKNLDKAYEVLTGLTVDDSDNLPPYLCTECSQRLLNSVQFRSKSIQANLILLEIIHKQDHLTIEAIKSCSDYQRFSSKLSMTQTQTDQYVMENEHVERENLHTHSQGYSEDLSNVYTANIKTEKDEDTSYFSMSPPKLHEVILPSIKLEKDDIYKQDNCSLEDDYENNLSTLHSNMGVKVKVEMIEITNPDIEGDSGHIADSNQDSISGEDYSSDDIILEDLQNVKRTANSHFTHAGTKHTKSSGKKVYTCDVCNKAFNQKHNLIPHLRIHSGVKPYSCDLCNERFSLKYNLVNHLRRHSGEKPYECNICKKTFILRNVLKAHIRTHTGEKPFACKICDKVFSQRANLIAHAKTHSGEKPYSCDVCNKGFSQRCNLISHSRTHSGEKPYSCNVCLISFSRNYHLKSHLKIHSGEKPHKCDICKKAFMSLSNLQKHKIIHSGVKPFLCTMCNRAFNRKGNLNTHIKTHSNVKPFLCLVCNKTFRRKDHLKTHFKVHGCETQLGVNNQFYIRESSGH